MRARWLAMSAFVSTSIVIAMPPLRCAYGTELPPVRSPLSPRESLAQIVVEPGLKVELVAHEPAVIDPVAIRFDEDGRLWVVEMRDYPTATPGGPRSRISVLSDRNGDGFFESANVFADGLPYATGAQPWKGGVFVTLAGQVAYMKDTDGDGKADIHETWFTGFSQENTQLRASHPRLALDNHIYIANGLRGGTIQSARDPQASPVSISGRDFRFDPLTGACEAVSGISQFGLAFDDYGNRFVCTNRNPAIHIVLEDRELRKNPLVAVPAVVHDVAKAADRSRVYPITRSWTTSNLHAGQFTAACGLTIYRGDVLPREYRGCLFVCEPTGHLVHRESMQPLGVTFESLPMHVDREFFASRDPWCCPVNLEVGPDGTLYVVDMYRAVIEHPEFMPAELRERSDLRDGDDRGRIYRIVPMDFQRSGPPQLSSTPNDALVEYLSHPNAWWRETAARLLLERQANSVNPKLRNAARSHTSTMARIHALWLLEGLDLLTSDLLGELLGDPEPRVVEQAINAGESLFAGSSELQRKLSPLVEDPDSRVRYRALLTTADLPTAPKSASDPWLTRAMLIAAGNQGGKVLARMLQDSTALERNVDEPGRFVADLARLAAATRDDKQLLLAVDALLSNEQFCRIGLGSLLSELARHGTTLADVRSKLSSHDQHKLDRAIAAACRDAANTESPDSARGEAIDLLGASGQASDLLASIALERSNQPLRIRAIAALAHHADLTPWRELLESYARETPALQSAILSAVLARAERTSLLLDEVAAGRISPGQLDTQSTTRVLEYRDPPIQKRAQALFADAMPIQREQALAAYQPALQLSADAERGRHVFRQQCATCHKIGDIGVNVATDISDSREKSAAQLLVDIIQPNRAIDANYFSYTAVTRDGVVHAGILAGETATSITLRQPDGKSISLRRDELDDLSTGGTSLMPDGLERLIPPQDMADLIAFIKNWRYLDDSPIRVQNGH